MKIGFLIRYFKIGAGGAENYAYYLARELAKSNEVHIFCSDKEEREEKIEGINIHRCKEKLKLSYYFGLYPSLTHKLIKADLDILHIIGFGFIQNEMSVKKLQRASPKTKVVCTPHGPFMALKNYSLFGKIIKRVYTSILKRYIQSYDLFFEDNPYQREWMSKEYNIPNNKIKFIPPGIDKSAFNSSKNINLPSLDISRLKNKIILTYLGRIQRYKGLDQLINILPKLKKYEKNIYFIAMGKDAGDRFRLEELARKIGVQENVLFTGEVTEEQKLSILDLSDIFIFPSEWEAFGIVILEAMARKNAVVSSRTEGGLFLVKEGVNGFLFDNGNSEELYGKITKLVSDKKLLGVIQKTNLEKSKKFLWPDITSQFKEVYKRLLMKKQ